MKLLMLSPTFPPLKSGGAFHAMHLAQSLAERGWDIQVVTSGIPGVIVPPGTQVHPVMQTWSWHEMPRLLRIARRFRPDVINIHFTGGIYNDQPMATFAPTFLKRILPGVRVVTQIEYPEPIAAERLSWRDRAGRKIAAWAAGKGADYGYGTLLRDSDRIIVLSDDHRRMLAPHCPSLDAKCVLIPPPPLMQMAENGDGVARRLGRQILGVGEDEFLLAYFGYLYPGKGLETLLSAFRLAAQKKNGLRLVIIGGSNEVVLKRSQHTSYADELRRAARAANIDNQIIWTGYTPPDSEVASVYLRAADACVLPFDDGVFLNRSSFASAVGHGLPTITTRGDILEPPFKDGENVLLCPPKNPGAIAESIDLLRRDSEVRGRLGRAALQLADDWFSWDKAIERTVQAFSA